MYFLVASICALSVLHSTDAFCERKYKMPYWVPKSLVQRAAEADIVIYANVTESPCLKPTSIYQQTTAAPTVANATNSSSSFQKLKAGADNPESNTTDVCVIGGLYNVSVLVHCVIKGGPVPRVVHLRAVGFGPGMCAYRSSMYYFTETVHSFHVYKGKNYVIFLGRHEGGSDSDGFWPHHVNMQFAAEEIIDERILQSVFAVAGGHAHYPTGVLANETHSICTPYTAGARNIRLTSVTLAVVLLSVLMLM